MFTGSNGVGKREESLLLTISITTGEDWDTTVLLLISINVTSDLGMDIGESLMTMGRDDHGDDPSMLQQPR